MVCSNRPRNPTLGTQSYAVCKSATSPIVIPSAKTGKNINSCGSGELCQYTINYPLTNVVVLNTGNYISLKQTQPQPRQSGNAGDADATYKGVNYKVTDIRIYSPSLHQFLGLGTGNSDVSGSYGGNALAELIICHSQIIAGTTQSSASGQDLYVCIPITQSSSTTSTSTIPGMKSFITILQHINAVANSSQGVATVDLIGSGFSFNTLIPRKPFYIYNGSTLFPPDNPVESGQTNGVPPCDSSNNTIIVFQEGSFMMPPSIPNLSSAGSTTPCDIFTNVVKQNKIYEALPWGGKDTTVQVQYNKNPPMTNVADGDDIYIDCQPVNKFGETQVPLDPTPGDSYTDWTKGALSQIMDGGLISAFLGAIIMIFIFHSAKKVFRALGHTPMGDAGSTTHSADHIASRVTKNRRNMVASENKEHVGLNKKIARSGLGRATTSGFNKAKSATSSGYSKLKSKLSSE